MYAVWTHDVCNLGNPLQIVSAEDFGTRIHVIQYASVYADRCVQARIFFDQSDRHRLSPVPYRPTCIASFHSVVQVVPMVEDTAVIRGFFTDVKHAGSLPRTLHTLKRILSVHGSDIGLRQDLPSMRRVLDHESVLMQVKRWVNNDLSFHSGVAARQP